MGVVDLFNLACHDFVSNLLDVDVTLGELLGQLLPKVITLLQSRSFGPLQDSLAFQHLVLVRH